MGGDIPAAGRSLQPQIERRRYLKCFTFIFLGTVLTVGGASCIYLAALKGDGDVAARYRLAGGWVLTVGAIMIAFGSVWSVLVYSKANKCACFDEVDSSANSGSGSRRGRRLHIDSELLNAHNHKHHHQHKHHQHRHS